MISISTLHGQYEPIKINNTPDLFEEIEQMLEEEMLEEVEVKANVIIAASISDHSNKGIAHFYQGQAVAMMNNFDYAIELFEESIRLFRIGGLKREESIVLAKLGDLYFYKGEYIKADSLYELSIDVSDGMERADILTDIYLNKSMIYVNKQESEIAMSYSKKALEVSDMLPDRERTKNILNQVATNYHSLGQLDSAIYYFEKLINLKKSITDKEGLISDYSAIGNLLRDRGSYQEAQDYLIKGLRLAESENDSLSTMTLYSEIGDVYAAQLLWTKAENHYQKALFVAQRKNRQFVIAGCMHKLADIYAGQKEDKRAIENYKNALNIYYKLGSKINAANIQIKLSKKFPSEQHIDLAKDYLLSALEERTLSADKLSILKVKMALADIEIMSGNKDTGVTLIKECITEFEAMNDREGLKEAYYLLSESYTKSNQYQLALDYHKRYKILSDSILSLEKSNAINELELLYSTEKKDKKLTEQKAAIEKQQLVSAEKSKRNRLLGLLGSAILLSVVIGLLYSQKVNKELTSKNSQIESQKDIIEEEHNRAEGLLLNILPESVADELKDKGYATPVHYNSATVLFTDFVGFTKVASTLTPTEVVNKLNECFMRFDEIAEKYNLEKIKTIGDAYMCAGGLPIKNNTHPKDAIQAAIEILSFIKSHNEKLIKQGKAVWEIRIGIHTGELVAGVVGSKKFAYDIWGDTVNVASRMEINAEIGHINISEATYDMIKDDFPCDYRGELDVKNRGKMGMYTVKI